LRRKLARDPAATDRANPAQALLGLTEIGPDNELWEYAALVTSLDDEILTLGQLYRDRADAENVFDELKNQWGWGGFTTQDPDAGCSPARWRWSIIGGVCSSDWPIPSITARRSPQGRCCCRRLRAEPSMPAK
jgi:hypothetical protein